MAQLNITLDDGFLKALMLGDREKGYDDAMRHLLEQVFNAVLSAEATEQVGAACTNGNAERQTYRNGYRTRGLPLAWEALCFISRSYVTAHSRQRSFAAMSAVNKRYYSA